MGIKFSKPNIKIKDQNLVKKILNSGWLTHGKYTKLFEKSLAMDLSTQLQFQAVRLAYI